MSLNKNRSCRDKELFDKIAKSYTEKDILPANRVARKQRLIQTLSHVPIGPDVDILEVGCGAGFAAEYLKGKYKGYYGLDHSKELIKWARAYHKLKRINFYNKSLMEFKVKQKFDVILLIGVLHHLTNLPESMKHMTSLLRPGGWIVANEPLAGNRVIRLSRSIRKLIDENYSNEQIEFTNEQIYNLFDYSGLENIHIVPQGVLSTPFAEVKMPFQNAAAILSKYACRIDQIIERNLKFVLSYFAWNVIATGRKH